uniref:fimbrial protein n=1 Tax=Serratia proteamaculans TaxID=28151 RepID=UPI001F4BD5CC|nr:fimbrial protein [Serratia proteamaculans]ULG18709.1 fimbrial protein [Serratia proteamaculans]
MKVKLLALALTTTLAGYSTMLLAADGTINFTGNITDTACTVDTASTNQTVNLGTVATTAFSAAGSTASPTRFTINLNTCPAAVKSANVRFDGNTNSANSNILALNSDQTATNVGVALYEQNSSTLIPVGNPTENVTLSSTNSNTLTYIAKYYSTATPVTAGTANSTATFTIAYN